MISEKREKIKMDKMMKTQWISCREFGGGEGAREEDGEGSEG